MDMMSLKKLTQYQKSNININNSIVKIKDFYNIMIKQILFITFLLSFNTFYSSNINKNETLFEAAIRNELNHIKYMIKKNININATNQDGMNALHLSSDINIVQLLIENGANINAINNFGSTPLHWAVSQDSQAITKLLIKHKANINYQDNNGNTPLHFAIFNNKELTLILIRAGANVNITNNMGSTPLLTALASGYLEIANYLTLAGAKNIKNSYGRSPIIYTSIDRGFELRESLKSQDIDPLIKSIFIEDYKQAIQLIEDGADLMIQDYNGDTALHWAFIKTNQNLIKLLLERGADYNFPNLKAETPLDILKKINNQDFILYIQDLLKDETNFIK